MAVIECGCRIPDATVIGYDDEQDPRRFEVSPAGVVRVTPESLGQRLPYVL